MRKRRGIKGQAMADFAPALFFLFIFLFFPLLNLMGMLVNYGCGWYFNFIETRELACRLHEDGRSGLVHDDILSKWKESGFYSFMGGESNSTIRSAASYDDAQGTLTNTTVIEVQPFMKMAFFSFVPGLGTSYTFTITTTRRQEETRDH